MIMTLIFHIKSPLESQQCMAVKRQPHMKIFHHNMLKRIAEVEESRREFLRQAKIEINPGWQYLRPLSEESSMPS